MASSVDGNMKAQNADLSFYCAQHLDENQMTLWREFANRVPWAHYYQDPAWAEIERRGSGMGARKPWFFWAETRGHICLVAIGVRRRLPLPGRVFWEFNKGPTFLDVSVLDEWLSWLLPRIRRGAARLHMSPATPLDRGGDEVATVLERHGLLRSSTEPEWVTLLVDIGGEEDEILADFRSETRYAIKKSRRLGITVSPEDTPDGWSAVATLQADLSLTARVPIVDESGMERISRHWLRGSDGGTVLVARQAGQAVAAALIVTYRGKAYLPLIPSSRRHRGLPASHLLVWEAVRWAKHHGCTTLDLVGYSLAAQPGEALWGVNQFKRGFASLDHLSKSVGVHEIVFSPLVVNLAAMARRYQTRLTFRFRKGARFEVPGLLRRIATVTEWNIGVADLELDNLVGNEHSTGANTLRPRVRWLRKPWFASFQADPCLLENDGRLFLYYEQVLAGSTRGRLRFTELDSTGMPVRRSTPMLTLRGHAAYPYVFEYSGIFYCVPETGTNNRVTLYRADAPAGPWHRECILLEGVHALDSTLFRFDDRWWLFCTVAGTDSRSQQSHLHIWHAPEPRGPWEPHLLQPAKVDIHSARPAGRPFVVNSVLYRPAQDCLPEYGARTVINRVLTLTPEGFAEEIVSYVEPHPADPYREGLHTITSAGGLVFVDGQRVRPSFNPFKVATATTVKVRDRLAQATRKRSILHQRPTHRP